MNKIKWNLFLPSFYETVQLPVLPADVEILDPFASDYVRKVFQLFCDKYYNDIDERTLLFGINPGRFGAGVTGVCFTDPIRLESECGISNSFDKKPELSSVFMYEMIRAFGGPAAFYSRFLLTAVSPLGFIQRGKNLNYYDIPGLKELFTDYIILQIERQLAMPVRRDTAFCIGMGTNYKVLSNLNKEHRWFKKIEVLPHPRWVMQYKLKDKGKYIEDYVQKLVRGPAL